MNDQNKKTLRQFQCRDYLWEIFEQMSGELECSVDYLINEAMRQYARSRNYGARTGPTPEPTGQRPIRNEQQPAPGASPRQRIPSQPAIPSAPPPPPQRTSQPQPGQSQPGQSQPGSYPGTAQPSAPSYAQVSPAPVQSAMPQPGSLQPPTLQGTGYPAPPPRSPGGSYPNQQPQTNVYSGGYGSPSAQSSNGPQGNYGGAQYPAPPGYSASASGPSASGPSAGPPAGYPAPPPYPAPPVVPRPAPSPPSSYPPPPLTTRPPAYGGGGSAPAGYGAPPPLPSAAPAPASATHAPGMPTLFVIFNGQKFPVNKEEFIIGRGTKTADLAIKDGNISRRHAAVIFQNGGFYMKDLGSTNGVEFQGRRVDGRRIEEGDVYQLCDYELRFTYR